MEKEYIETETEVNIIRPEIPGEKEPPTEEEKIINRFLKDIVDRKEEKMIGTEGGTQKVVVTLENVFDAWYDFKKEWYGKKNA